MSEQKTSTPASSSMAVSFETMAWRRARFMAPTAMVTDSTAGRATGMAETVSTRAKRRISSGASPRNSATITIRATRKRVTKIRKLPIWITIFWKWLRSSSEARETSSTTEWKRV